MANERFTNAIRGVVQPTPPIWLMRQAGRYHSHYQGLREKHSFMELCKEPELAAQVALGPVEDFDFDIAILFSDLLFPLEAMGMGLTYGGSGPKLGWHLTPDNVDRLLPVEEAVGDLVFQREAVKRTREVLPDTKSLIGFVGGAWTLFRYAASGTHQPVAGDAAWDLWERFAEHLLPLLERNIELQLEGGAEVVMVLDTSAGQLEPDRFQEVVIPYLQRLTARFPGQLGYYSKTSRPQHYEHAFFASGAVAGFGVDSSWDMPQALKRFGGTGFVQGNFSEEIFLQSPREFRSQLVDYLKRMSALTEEERKGWICGAGHGIKPGTPEDNVRAFVTMTREVLR